MNNEEVIKNKVCEITVGSIMYGTNTPNSDIDKVGVFIAPENYYLGLDKIEEVDLSTVSKQDNGKNDKDAIDRKFYEIRQFFRLALQNNPNIIELLFAKDTVNFTTPIWKTITDNVEYFLDGTQIRNRFIGYAISQKKKMFIKHENYDILNEAYRILEDSDCKFISDDECFKKFEFRCNINTEYRVADIFIPRNSSVKRAMEILQTRLGRVGNRQDLILQYGYDTKFSSHLLRILLEGRELLSTGNLIFPLKDKEFIKSIKEGNYKIEEVISIADSLEAEIRNIDVKNCKSNYNKVNDLLINITKQELLK